MKKSFLFCCILTSLFIVVSSVNAQTIQRQNTTNKTIGLQRKIQATPKTDKEKAIILRDQIINSIKNVPSQKKQEIYKKSWDSLSEPEKEQIKANIQKRWNEMPEDEKAKFRDQIKKNWENLPQAQKDELNNKIKESINNLPEEEKQKIRDAFKTKLNNMSPEEKSALRKKLIAELQKADAEQDAKDAARKKLIDSKK